MAGAAALALLAGLGYYYFRASLQANEMVERHLRLLQSAAAALDAQRRWAETEAWKRGSALEEPADDPDRTDLRIDPPQGGGWDEQPPHVRWRLVGDAIRWRLEGQYDSATLTLQPQEHLDWVLRSTREDGEFETVFLAGSDGRILQQAGRGLQVSLDALVDDWQHLREGNKIAETTIGDVPHVLFLHPAYWDIDGTDGQPRGLTLGGLMKRRARTYAALAMPLPIVALAVGALLLIFINWPFLKLLLVGDWQRVRWMDAVLVGVSACLTLSLVTIFGLGLASYWRAGQDVDNHLVRLSERIRERLSAEIDKATNQLTSLVEFALPRVVTLVPAPPEPCGKPGAQVEGVPGLYQPDWTLDAFEPFEYPYFESFAIIDRCGMQVVKWAPPPALPPPRINLQDRQYVRAFLGAGPHPSYFLESISSQTTGRREAVLSMPIRGFGAPAHLPVAALSLDMPSLIDPVIVSGFGFAMIDEEGVVVFHSESRKNLVENLIEETGAERRLLSAIFARRTAHFDMRYGGRDYRAYAAPLEALPWMLVTFHDKEDKRTALVELVTTSVLLAVASLAMLLLVLSGLLLAAPRPNRTAWLWPDARRYTAYRDLAAAHAAFIAAIGLAIAASDDIDLLLTAVMLPALGLLTMFLRLTDQPKDAGLVRLQALRIAAAIAAAVIALGVVALAQHLRQAGQAWVWLIPVLAAAGVLIGVNDSLRRFAAPAGTTRAAAGPGDARRTAHAYVVAAFFTLLLTSALPALAVFMVACGVHLELFLRHAQLSLARDLAAYRPRSASVEPGPDRWHVYDGFFFGTTAGGDGACASEPGGSDQEHLLHFGIHALPYYSPRSIEMRELVHDAAADGTWRWVDCEEGTVQLHWGLADTQPPRMVVASERARPLGVVERVVDKSEKASTEDGGVRWGLLAMPYSIGLLVLFLAWVISRFIANRIFLLNVAAPSWLAARSVIRPPIHDSLLIVCRRPEDAARVVDVASFSEVHLDAPVPDMPRGDTRPGAARLIRDFDRCWGSRKLRDACLTRLEQLIRVEQQRVVITAGPDLFEVPAASPAALPAPDVDARTRLLDLVLVVEADRWLAPVPAVDRPVDPVLLRVLEGEEPGPGDIPGGEALTAQQLQDEIVEATRNYYAWVWASCTRRERRVLMHLAEEGLVNDKDHRTLRRLLVRGLIRRDPELGPMTESFRRYLLSKSRDPAAVAATPDPRSAWDIIRFPLLGTFTAGMLFLFVTQQELFNQATALASAAAVAMPAVLKLLGTLAGPRSTAPPPA